MTICEIKYDSDWDDLLFIGMDTETGQTVEIRENPGVVIAILSECIKKYNLPFEVTIKEQDEKKENGMKVTISPTGVKKTVITEGGVTSTTIEQQKEKREINFNEATEAKRREEFEQKMKRPKKKPMLDPCPDCKSDMKFGRHKVLGFYKKCTNPDCKHIEYLMKRD